MNVFATFIAFVLLSTTANADVMVTGASARAVPPGQSVSASFMTLMNHGTAQVALTSAESSVAERVELHRHSHEGEIMKMRRIEQITLLANETVELKPGGLHIMLFGLKHSLQIGETIDLRLHFSDGNSQSLSMPVEAIMPAMGKSHVH